MIVKIPMEGTLAPVHLGITLLMSTTAVTSTNAPPVVIIVAIMQYAATLMVDLFAVVNQAIWGMVLFVQVYLICRILLWEIISFRITMRARYNALQRCWIPIVSQ